MPMQKDQNPSARETSVPLPAVEQERGRVAQQVRVTPPRLLCPARYLFLDPFFVETSVHISLKLLFLFLRLWKTQSKRKINVSSSNKTTQ